MARRATSSWPTGPRLFIDGGPPQPPELASGIGVVHRWNAEAGRLRPAGAVSRAIVRSGSRPTGRRLPPRRAGPGHRPGGLGKDPGADRASAAPRHRVRRAPGHASRRWRTTTRRPRKCGSAAPTSTAAQALNIRTLNSLGLWICNEFGAAGRLRVLEEPAVRDLLQRHIEIRRQSNTDTVAPYIEALSAIRLGLTAPHLVEEAIPDAAGHRRGIRPLPCRAGRRRCGRLRRADLPGHRDPADRSGGPGSRPGQVPLPPGRRVPGPQPGPPAPHPAPGRPVLRLLRGRATTIRSFTGTPGPPPSSSSTIPATSPAPAPMPLTVNYRCPPAVIDAARHLLSYNARRLDKEIHPPDGQVDAPGAFGAPLAGRGPVAVLTAPADALAGLAVETIAAWRAGGVDPGDIAVLARVNSALLPVQVACMEAGVPCSTPLSAGVLQRTGIRTAFAYLRIGTDPEHITREDILETIRRPSRGIAPKVVDMLTSRPDHLDHRHPATGRPALGPRRPQARASTPATSRPWCGAASAPRSPPSRPSGVEVGLGETMDVLDSSRSEADRSTHTDDLAALESVAALHPDVATFEQLAARGVEPDGRPRGPRCCSPPSIASRGASGTTSSSSTPRGPVPPPARERRGGRATRLPRRPHPGPQPGGRAGRRRRTLHLPGRTRRDPRATGARQRGDEWSWRTRPAGATGTPTPGRGARATKGTTKGKGSRVFAEVALPTVEAVPGLVVDDRGTVGTVVEVTAEAAILSAGTVRLKVALGTDVRIDGQTVTLVGPGLGRRGRRGREGTARLAVGPGEPGCGPGLCHLEGRRTCRDRRPGSRHPGRAGRLPGDGADPPRALGRRDPGRPRYGPGQRCINESRRTEFSEHAGHGSKGPFGSCRAMKSMTAGDASWSMCARTFASVQSHHRIRERAARTGSSNRYEISLAGTPPTIA